MNKHFKRAARDAGLFLGVAHMAQPQRRLIIGQRRHHGKLSSILSRVEDVFRVTKCQVPDRQARGENPSVLSHGGTYQDTQRTQAPFSQLIRCSITQVQVACEIFDYIEVTYYRILCRFPPNNEAQVS